MSSSPRKVVVISGYFNPGPHRGHVDYARLAKEFAGPDGIVYVIVNTDHQAVLKKGFSFIPEEDRVAAMGALKYVEAAYLSVDTDRSVCKSIEWLYNNAPHKPTHFANGGDQTADRACPEEVVCKKLGIELVYGLGDKIQSSSWILEKSVKDAYRMMFASKE